MKSYQFFVQAFAIFCCSHLAISSEVPECEPSSVLRYYIQNDIEGSTPVVHCADLNGDSFADLIFVAAWASRVEIVVHLGRGDGSFEPSTSYPIPEPRSYYGQRVSIRTADLDADGDTDVVIGDSGGVFVLWNDGLGVLEQTLISQTGTAWKTSIDTGDVDGDGIPEIVFALAGTADIVILQLNQNHEYDEQSRYSAGSGVSAVRIADLDLDDDQDLMFAHSIDDWYVLFNDGDASFVLSDKLEVALEPSLVLADIDNDGDPDLIGSRLIPLIGDRHYLIIVQKNNGDGTFEFPGWYERVPDRIDALAVEDIDGDGYKDILATAYDGWDLILFPNDGTGSFDEDADYRSWVRPKDIAIGDIDGDGRPDAVLARDFYETFTVLLNRCYEEALYYCPDFNGDGALDYFDISEYSIAFISQQPTADFNGDGNFTTHDISAFLDSFRDSCPDTME